MSTPLHELPRPITQPPPRPLQTPAIAVSLILGGSLVIAALILGGAWLLGPKTGTYATDRMKVEEPHTFIKNDKGQILRFNKQSGILMSIDGIDIGYLATPVTINHQYLSPTGTLAAVTLRCSWRNGKLYCVATGPSIPIEVWTAGGQEPAEFDWYTISIRDGNGSEIVRFTARYDGAATAVGSAECSALDYATFVSAKNVKILESGVDIRRLSAGGTWQMTLEDGTQLSTQAYWRNGQLYCAALFQNPSETLKALMKKEPRGEWLQMVFLDMDGNECARCTLHGLETVKGQPKFHAFGRLAVSGTDCARMDWRAAWNKPGWDAIKK